MRPGILNDVRSFEDPHIIYIYILHVYIFPKNSRRSLIRGLATERRLQVISSPMLAHIVCWGGTQEAVCTEL